MRRIVAITVLAAALSGCGEPKIDGSSDQAFKESIAKVSKGLTEDQRAKFKSDMMLLAFQGVDFGKVLQGKAKPEDMSENMKSGLDGMTASQVSAKADQVRKEREEKERIQAVSEIADLQRKKAQSDTAKTSLMKFSVEKSRFYKQKQEYGFRDQPVIEMTVVNGTGEPVSHAYFKGTISSPGRSVPWLVDEFNYSISGGIEPGEKKEWRLAPNQFSDWGKVDAPKDALFTVEVVRLDGADGKPLFGGGEFTERDAARLASLREKYPD